MRPMCLPRLGRVLLAAAALVFLPTANAQPVSTPDANPPAPRRPCLIFIRCDGLGYGDLSCYGQTKFQTPNLDQLAAGGIRFTRYYAGDAAGSPADAALMLGRDSTHLPQRADADVPLAADDITVAQWLQQSGYHTALIGEWRLGGDGTSGAPWKKGFDEFNGFTDPADAGNYYSDYVWRYMPKSLLKPATEQPAAFNGREELYANADGKKGQYIPDLFAAAAGNFIRVNQPDQFNRYRPFFLLLNLTIARPGAGDVMPVPTDAPYSDEPWPQSERNRAAMIARLDDHIGQLLDQLKRLNLQSNTVIFFSSDTGPQTGGGVNPKFFQSAGPFRGQRGDLYEGGLRVPMIVSWPGKIRPGQVSDFPWAAWDFLPTALQLALREPPKNIDGISVLPTLLGETQTNRHDAFSWALQDRDLAQAVRRGDWKIVRAKASDKWELYNLKTDPGETMDVADKDPDVMAKFERLLKK
ncbi:MAG TPA: sulfatase-like hydrolase/transferase [Candidatus Sulfopaludibacter sp.]|nr:sulfatase-like hydrolase/transferase [Candidatus Sulfopaludibacter sp.]